MSRARSGSRSTGGTATTSSRPFSGPRAPDLSPWSWCCTGAGTAALSAASPGAGVRGVAGDPRAPLPLRVKPAPPSTQEVIAGLAAPVLLLHGTADPVVPVEQSREYERAARALRKSVT